MKSPIEVKDAWKRIRAWYRKRVKDKELLNSLLDWGPPATAAQIKACQNAIGLTFPPDVEVTYRQFNGTDLNWPLPGGSLLSLDEVVRTMQLWRELQDPEMDKQCNPKGPIKKTMWNLNWIPIMDNGGGDNQCVDLTPEKGGVVGQFIKMNHEVGPQYVIAPSFGDFVCNHANELEQGKWTLSEEGDQQRVN